MGAEESVPDPREFNFLGMTFMCTEEYLKTQKREEYEVLFAIPYLLVWFDVFIWATIGLFLGPAKSWALSVENDWYSRMVIVESDGTESYSWYKLLQPYRFEWLICDPIMFKYFIFHPFFFWIPPFNPFDNLFGEITEIPE